MKKFLRVSIVVCILMALLCGAAMADGIVSNGYAAKSTVGERTASFLSSPYMYGPSNVTISANGLSARISWTKDSGSLVSGYVVFQCKRATTLPSYLPYGWYTRRSDGYYWYPVSLIGTTTNNYMDIKASSAGTYYIEVDSYYLSYNSYVSSIGGFTTFKATNSNSVTAPKTVNVEQTGSNKVKLTWTAGEGAKSYAVYRATGSGSFSKIGTTKSLTYTDKKAKNGKTYRYKIQAINGSKKATSKIVKAYPMAKPTSLKAKSSKDNVTLSWKKVTGAKQYVVYQQAPGASAFTQVKSTTAKKVTFSATSGNGTYKFYVVGAVDGFEGLKSATASVKVTGSSTQSGVAYRALIVANSYSSTSNALYGTLNDAKAMEGALKGLAQNWNVTVKKNVEASEILSAISSAFAGADADDVCLFYYSGHGVTSTGSGSGALCGNSLSSYVYMSELASALDAACPGKVIVLLDSCGSGAGINKGESPAALAQAAVDAFSKRNRQLTDKYGELCGSKFEVLVAASQHTSSYDLSTGLNGYNCGAFTYSLLTSIGASYPNGSFSSSMPGDANGDKALSLKEGYNSICSIVSEHGWDSSGNQCTQYYGDDNFILFQR